MRKKSIRSRVACFEYVYLVPVLLDISKLECSPRVSPSNAFSSQETIENNKKSGTLKIGNTGVGIATADAVRLLTVLLKEGREIS